jgi:hypothetical protein
VKEVRVEVILGDGVGVYGLCVAIVEWVKEGEGETLGMLEYVKKRSIKKESPAGKGLQMAI